MGSPMTTSLPRDICELSIDELLAPLPATTQLGGRGPFVINLHASSAPISLSEAGIEGCRQARVYQIKRVEDHRMRYRLRLGPFSTENEAEAVLRKARETYPSALTATADAEDVRAFGKMRFRTDADPIAVAAPAQKPAAALPRAAPPAAAPARMMAAVPRAAKPAKLTAAPPTLFDAVPVDRRSRAVALPSSTLVDREAPSDRQSLSLETTQTVRALTMLELEEEVAERWYVIQLELSDHAIDPDTVENLDIFHVYRLYSVSGHDQGRFVHSLRLGFFSEEVAAKAVAGYLTAHYDDPTIKRVSAAERERFSEQRLKPRKDAGDTGKFAAIEITSDRIVRERPVTKLNTKREPSTRA